MYHVSVFSLVFSQYPLLFLLASIFGRGAVGISDKKALEFVSKMFAEAAKLVGVTAVPLCRNGLFHQGLRRFEA